MRVLIAPNSFKGTLTSIEAAQAMSEGIAAAFPHAQIEPFPLADGGEGTISVLVKACGGTIEQASVMNAEGEIVSVNYGILGPSEPEANLQTTAFHSTAQTKAESQSTDRVTAVLEVAEIVGLTRLSTSPLPVSWRTSFGVGQLLKILLQKGIQNFLVGLGGSSTNDAGAGLLYALGIQFIGTKGQQLLPLVGSSETQKAPETRLTFDQQKKLDRMIQDFYANQEFQTPSNAFDTLTQLEQVEGLKELSQMFGQCTSLTILADVDNPLCGPNGATTIFGPQKGVAEDEIHFIDQVLERFGNLLDKALGTSYSQHPGAGAAGGLGFALQLLGGRMESGADTICKRSGFDTAVANADWVITGEGCSDLQTLAGKGPAAVANKARMAGIPVTLVSGNIAPQALPALNQWFTGGCHAATPAGEIPDRHRAAQLLRECCAAMKSPT